MKLSVRETNPLVEAPELHVKLWLQKRADGIALRGIDGEGIQQTIMLIRPNGFLRFGLGTDWFEQNSEGEIQEL